MVVMRPFEATINGAECLRDAERAEHVHVHHPLEVLVLRIDQRTDDGDARVVHEAIEATARLGDRLDRGSDLGRVRDVESHGVDVLDRVELGEVAVLAGARVDEVAVLRQPLGDLAADAGAGAGDQHGFLRGGSGCRCWCGIGGPDWSSQHQAEHADQYAAADEQSLPMSHHAFDHFHCWPLGMNVVCGMVRQPVAAGEAAAVPRAVNQATCLHLVDHDLYGLYSLFRLLIMCHGRGRAAVSRRRYSGVEEARQNLPSLLADAKSGKPVVITKHGKPYAAIVPLEALPDARTGPSIHALRGSGAGLWGDDAAAWIDRMRDEW